MQQVVLVGIDPARQADLARAQLAALFNATASQIDQMLESPAYVLKKGLLEEEAARYKTSIETAGGLCRIEIEPTPIIPLEVNLPTASLPVHGESEFVCSACGGAVDVSDVWCKQCGINVSELEAEGDPLSAAPAKAEKLGSSPDQAASVVNRFEAKTVVMVGASKSVGLAFVLALLFGPLGLLYASVTGAIVMFMLGAFVAIFTFGFGALFTWPLCVIWAVVAANSYNRNLVASMQEAS